MDRELISFIQSAHEMGQDVMADWKDLFKVWCYWHVQRGKHSCINETAFKAICEAIAMGKTPHVSWITWCFSKLTSKRLNDVTTTHIDYASELELHVV